MSSSQNLGESLGLDQEQSHFDLSQNQKQDE